jgi:glycosyltransferase involved in cell wall biosynthesis
LHDIGPQLAEGQAMARQLQQAGWQGELKWSSLPGLDVMQAAGCLFFPSPSPRNLAHLRNQRDPHGFSLMGMTYTLSSTGAIEQVAELILPPFKPWDALICISQCAKDFTLQLHEEMRAWWTAQAGSVQFNTPELPVILLGVDVPFYAPQPGKKTTARQNLGILPDEALFLFSGRLAFHAKANPAPLYQALEQVARETPIVCIEAGIFPSESIRQGFLAAQQTLAPSVRFIWVDGQDEAAYQGAWQAADVFVSLSDNIQETFGLTPVEAMAAGLPVIVSDWNGYRETIRDGIDGFRIPTVLPPAGAGADLALRHALKLDTYDYYIGLASMATVVAPDALREAVRRLATDSALRERMGAAGQARANAIFDWPVILQQYVALAEHLDTLRTAAPACTPVAWPQWADPFHRFAHFSSATLTGDMSLRASPDAAVRYQELVSLAMARYVFDPQRFPRESVDAVLAVLIKDSPQTVNTILTTAGQATPIGIRALMWLWKFRLIGPAA